MQDPPYDGNVIYSLSELGLFLRHAWFSWTLQRRLTCCKSCISTKGPLPWKWHDTRSQQHDDFDVAWERKGSAASPCERGSWRRSFRKRRALDNFQYAFVSLCCHTDKHSQELHRQLDRIAYQACQGPWKSHDHSLDHLPLCLQSRCLSKLSALPPFGEQNGEALTWPLAAKTSNAHNRHMTLINLGQPPY